VTKADDLLQEAGKKSEGIRVLGQNCPARSVIEKLCNIGKAIPSLGCFRVLGE
jgi:hypothetical protein